MFLSSAPTVLLLALLLSVTSVHTTQVVGRDAFRPSNGKLLQGLDIHGRQATSPYITIVRGLLRSEKIVRYASDIPCNIIQTLETDGAEAETFVKQLQQGRTPTIIQDLPDEVKGAFFDVVNIFLTLPSQLIGAAQAAVTDAANIFDDIESGAIVTDIENLPGVVLSDATSAWGDFTSGLVDDWNAATNAIACLFRGCQVTTSAADACGTAISTTAAPIVYTTPYVVSSTATYNSATESAYFASLANAQSAAEASATAQATVQSQLASKSAWLATVSESVLVQQTAPPPSPNNGATQQGANQQGLPKTSTSTSTTPAPAPQATVEFSNGSSSLAELNALGICCAAALGMLGVALLL